MNRQWNQIFHAPSMNTGSKLAYSSEIRQPRGQQKNVDSSCEIINNWNSTVIAFIVTIIFPRLTEVRFKVHCISSDKTGDILYALAIDYWNLQSQVRLSTKLCQTTGQSEATQVSGKHESIAEIHYHEGNWVDKHYCTFSHAENWCNHWLQITNL